MNTGAEKGRGRRRDDFVVTAVLLTLGDTGATWHYTSEGGGGGGGKKPV